MRPLRDSIPRALPLLPSGPVDHVAVLAAVQRPGPAFDPAQVFDRALFGLTEAETRDLGPVLSQVCEVAFEALECSGLRFDRLRAQRAATFLGVADPAWITTKDASFLADLLGMPGPASTLLEAGVGLSVALHHACEAIRSREIDLALVAGDVGPGAGALVVARARSSLASGRVRALLLASAVSRASDEYRASTIAAARAALEEKSLETVSETGLAGLIRSFEMTRGGRPPVVMATDAGELVDIAFLCGSAEAAATQLATMDVSSGPLLSAASPPRILGLSARTTSSLRQLAEAARQRLGTVLDVHSLAADALGRPAHEHRLAIPVGTVEEVQQGLTAFLTDAPGAPHAGYALEASVAFLIPPAGAQFLNMTDGLYESEPVYRDALNRLDRALRTALPRPLLSILFPDPSRQVRLDDPVFANPVTFAVAFALGELLKSRGVVPGAVLGCGVGELAAAAIAGAVDPDQAARVAAERGRLLGTLEGPAGRAVLEGSEAAARELTADEPDVDVMAVPMPDRVVVGGSLEGVERVVERATRAGLRTRRMAGFPNNTPLVDPIVSDFARLASAQPFQSPEVALVSATSGRRIEHADASYWAATLRGPVRFSQAVETLYALGCRSFVELSRPALMKAGERTLSSQPSFWFAAIDRNRPDAFHLDRLLAALWVVGVPVERGGHSSDSPVVPSFPGGSELPTYPWDRRPLDEEERQRLVAELHGPSLPEDEGWLPDLDDLDELQVRQTSATMEGAPGRPLLELGDGRRTPPPGSRTEIHLRSLVPEGEPVASFDPALSGTSWAPERAVTLVPVEEREDVAAENVVPLKTPNRSPSSRPPLPMATVEMQLTPEPSPTTPEEDVPVWEEGWVEDPMPDHAAGPSRTWLVLADRGGVGDYVAKLLDAAGQRTLVIADPPASWDDVLERIAVDAAIRVVHLWSLEPIDAAAERRGQPRPTAVLAPALTGWLQVLGLIRALTRRGRSARMHLVTRGAIKPVEWSQALMGGAAWGLARGLSADAPEWFAGIVEIDPEDEDPERLVAHLLDADSEPRERAEFVFRAGQRWRRRIERRVHLPPAGPLDVDGTWVIAGDLDRPMLDLASTLVSRGVTRIFFVSPSAPESDVLQQVLDLQRRGIACMVVRVDPTEERDVAQLTARIGREAQIRGIVHRVAARRRSLLDLDLAQAETDWQQLLAMGAVLASLPVMGQRWLWVEGASLAGGADAGLPGVAGEALAAAARVPTEERGVVSVVHSSPEEDPGRIVRLLLRLGPAGGVYGAGRRTTGS